VGRGRRAGEGDCGGELRGAGGCSGPEGGDGGEDAHICGRAGGGGYRGCGAENGVEQWRGRGGLVKNAGIVVGEAVAPHPVLGIATFFLFAGGTPRIPFTVIAKSAHLS